MDTDILVPRVLGRLNSEEYVGSVEELDRLELEPFRSFRDARAAVLQAQGLEKVKLWVQNRIQEPRFDDPDAKMPRTSLSEEEAARIATHLVGVQPSKTPAKSKGLFRKINPVGDIADFFEDRLPIATRDNAKNFLAAFFGLGLFAGIGGTAVAFLFLRWKRRKPDAKSFAQVVRTAIPSNLVRSLCGRVRRLLHR